MEINYDKLATWIAERLEPFKKSKVLLDQYCAASGDDFGLLDSCIYLGNLSIDQIQKVGAAKIPPSCWHTMVVLADEGGDFFETGIKVAEAHKRDGAPGGVPLVIKLRAVLGAKRQTAYSPGDLYAASAIALKYSVLKPKDASVFRNMAGYLKRNGALSPKQIGFIGSLLGKLRLAKVTGSTAEEKDVLCRLYAMID